MARIEAVRVAQDPDYAAGLSDTDWYQLAQDPAWQELVAEQSEMVSSVIAVHGHKLPGASRADGNATGAAALPAAFKIVGTDVARIQGFVFVIAAAQYTENMRMP